MRMIREVLLHVCVVCSFCCIMAGILDYYNPYMDFGGHILALRYMLYIGVILLMICRRETNLHQLKRKKKIIVKV